MPPLPWTPDFDHHPVVYTIRSAQIVDGHVQLGWSDGRTSSHHALLLRENSPDDATVHPLSREMLISPLDLPSDLRAVSVQVDDDGALLVTWSHGGDASRFHPGWLRNHAWFDDTPPVKSACVLWTAASQPEPPTFDGPSTLADPALFLNWLQALRDYGVARLRGLTPRDGLLEQVVTRIGPVRESNFGRMYTLEVKDDPDSNAYTSSALLQHSDMPTRESPHGLQFLLCRENTTTGGEGVYVDALCIADDMRREQPAMFDCLTTVVWEFNNRAKTSSYRAHGPIFETDADGQVTGVRYTAWLRAPLQAPLAVQDRAYSSVRALTARAQDPAYQMVFAYQSGDLLAFDNRRVLHGRRGYDAAGGKRFIEGIYSDRDDLHSAIRVLQRQRLRQEGAR